MAFCLCIGGYAGALFATSQTLQYTPLVAIVTIPSALVFGLPAFFILRRFRILNIFSVSLIGVVASILVALALLSLRPGHVSEVLSCCFIVIGLVSSVIAFLAICLFGITRTTPQV